MQVLCFNNFHRNGFLNIFNVYFSVHHSNQFYKHVPKGDKKKHEYLLPSQQTNQQTAG